MPLDNRVFLAHCDEYEQAAEAVGRVLDAFGTAEGILGGRKKVLVKPNLIRPCKPEDAATTHPAVIAAVCSAFVKAGADVTIIDSTGGPHTRIVLKLLYGKTGMREAAEKSGAVLSFDTSIKKVTFPDGKIIKKLDLLAPVPDADLVISVAKAKTHGFQSMTGCVKNLFGCVPGMGKPLLHGKHTNREEFAAMLVDVCQRVAPGFSILDGVWGMEGAGPTAGEPKHLRIIAGGYSPYAVDLAQCYLMGLRADSVYTLLEAAKRGLAPASFGELTWLGDNPEEHRQSFLPATKRMDDAVPVIEDNCTGCGECERICPMHCICIESGTTDGKGGSTTTGTTDGKGGSTTTGTTDGNIKAVINEKKCIRCYCCHEFCPAKAISL